MVNGRPRDACASRGRPKTVNRSPFTAVPSPPPPAHIPRLMSYRLISPDGTRSYDLKMHAPMIIGRAPTCDLPVFDPTISRRHAELVCDDSGVSLRDLGSSNGTFVNGARIETAEIGRASCRERVEISVVGASLKKRRK